MMRRASAAVANSGTSRVVTFMPYCGRSGGAKNRLWMSKPPARPMAAGASPKRSISVVPRIRCTSDTPTGWCGNTSKKQNTSITVKTERSSRPMGPSLRKVSKATLPV
ncbi:hypothetical protein D3C72_1657640 [compost metagenome]